jgi:hypothetical protein
MSVFDMSALVVESTAAKKRHVAMARPAKPPTAPLPEVRKEQQQVSARTEILAATGRGQQPQTLVSAASVHSIRLERLREWLSGVQLTLGELALHQDAVETYVVRCLLDKAFTSDDRAFCEQQAAHLLEPEAAATRISDELALAFQDALNAMLLRHDRLFVDYCAQFDAPFAEYAAALVISPNIMQYLKWLAFNARLGHAIPDTLANAVRTRQTHRVEPAIESPFLARRKKPNRVHCLAESLHHQTSNGIGTGRKSARQRR